MATNPPKRQFPKPNRSVIRWLLDSDPAIRWQVLRDLIHAPAEVVAAERARVATEGWGARLLALQGEDGQWAGGACFPARSFNQSDEKIGQPWTATLPTLQLLRDFGVDPCSEWVRRAVALVRDHCRWEHAGQPFFSGEVEPCINGRTVTLGTYFDQDGEHTSRQGPLCARGRRQSAQPVEHAVE
jgi:hypothetical protein